ncbi:hypothetical protein MAR_027561 [Mya arenaria]|uniref:Uncharacterized protein n=1 Tax=Mya arenaria TaxID=6604 RepID=A0ABY7EX25_MYAAR|nr:hypothetical protein MAR_027561 [Mya arenaria]
MLQALMNVSINCLEVLSKGHFPTAVLSGVQFLHKFLQTTRTPFPSSLDPRLSMISYADELLALKLFLLKKTQSNAGLDEIPSFGFDCGGSIIFHHREDLPADDPTREFPLINTCSLEL